MMLHLLRPQLGCFWRITTIYALSLTIVDLMVPCTKPRSELDYRIY